MSGHRKPGYARHRTDLTASVLTQYAQAQGVGVELLGGTVDAVWWLGDVVRLVDYKSGRKAPITASQGKLLARGCPLHFVVTVSDVDLIVADMRRERR